MRHQHQYQIVLVLHPSRMEQKDAAEGQLSSMAVEQSLYESRRGCPDQRKDPGYRQSDHLPGIQKDQCSLIFLCQWILKLEYWNALKRN